MSKTTNYNTSRKRIAILLPDLRSGGAEKLHIHLAEYFTSRGYFVDFVLLQKQGELLGDLPENTRTIDLHAARIRNALFPLIKYIRSEHPDALIVAMWPLTILGVIANRLSFRSTRLLVSDHNYLPKTPYGRGLSGLVMKITIRLFYPLADSVVAVSQGVKEVIVHLSGLKSEKVDVIYNPIKTEYSVQSKPDADIHEWWLQSDLKLIAVGSLKPQKAFDTLILALHEARKTINVRLLILGEGPERKSLETLVSKLNLTDSVRLAGFRPNPHCYFSIADLFVLSSRYEGFGNVIVEAMASGTPIIATDCDSGPSEILDAGKYGILVPVDDPKALSLAIVRSYKSAYDQQDLINRARTFSVERAGSRYLDLLLPS